MKHYELTYLISSELSSPEAKNFQEKIISLIQEKKGILVNGTAPLNKKLAYPIRQTNVQRKQTDAYLAVLNFQMESEGLADFEKQLKTEGQILRYLLLSKKPKTARILAGKKPRVVRKIEPLLTRPVPHEHKKKVELKELEEKIEEILKE